MPAIEPFIGLYSKALRQVLPCLSGQETKVFLAVAAHADDQGKCWPGVRELADITTYPEKVVSDLLADLEEKNFVVTLRRSECDPLTGRLMPNVYAVSPDLLLVSDRSLWDDFRFRHVSIPESTFPLKSVQADRTTEAEVFKQNQRSRTTAPEGAAALSNANTPVVATRSGETIGENGGTRSTAGSGNATNSLPQARTPPGSAAPPSLRPLTIPEMAAVQGIKNHVRDMSHETAADLVIRYGVEQFTAAVMSYKARSAKINIKKPTGWIIQNLKMGEKRK
jgi:hypothetical protein